MIIALFALLLQTEAPPKPDPRPWRDVEISLGGYLATLDTQLNVGTASGLGTTIDAEDLLDLDDSVLSWRLGASVALGQRHRLYADAFDVSRKASATLTQDVDFNGTTYPIGTQLDTKLVVQIYELTYGYSVLQDERVDLALTIGIHGIRTAVSLESSSGRTGKERFFLPIPLPGLRFDVALTPKLWLRERAEFLWVGTPDYRGLLTNLSTNLEYALFDHVALGVGYTTMRTKFTMNTDSFPSVSFRGEFDYQYAGVQFYVDVFF